MKHVFNEIDAAAVRVTSFVQLLVRAAAAILVEMTSTVVGSTAGTRRRNYHRERLLFLLLGHFVRLCWKTFHVKNSLQELIYDTESQLELPSLRAIVFSSKNKFKIEHYGQALSLQCNGDTICYELKSQFSGA